MPAITAEDNDLAKDRLDERRDLQTSEKLIFAPAINEMDNTGMHDKSKLGESHHEQDHQNNS